MTDGQPADCMQTVEPCHATLQSPLSADVVAPSKNINKLSLIDPRDKIVL